jgi:hypothetical protein
MPNKKPASRSAAKLNPQLAIQLERLSRTIGAPVDDAAIDRILATVDLAGTAGILAESYEAAKPDLDGSTRIFAEGKETNKLSGSQVAEIKRWRRGGSVCSMLSFLKATVRQREMSTLRTRKAIVTAKASLSSGAMATLRSDPSYDASLKLAEMAIDRLQESLEGARAWTDERIAGEYLPNQYHGIFGKRPKMTRRKFVGEEVHISEAIRFIQAVLDELGISYQEESIISAMQAAKKPKRYR